MNGKMEPVTAAGGGSQPRWGSKAAGEGYIHVGGVPTHTQLRAVAKAALTKQTVSQRCKPTSISRASVAVTAATHLCGQPTKQLRAAAPATAACHRATFVKSCTAFREINKTGGIARPKTRPFDVGREA